MTSCWVCTKNLCFSSDALSREPAMLRRWAWILHLLILNGGNGLELAYNRGSCILLPCTTLEYKLVAASYQEYECGLLFSKSVKIDSAFRKQHFSFAYLLCNTPCLSTKFCITFVFNFSWVLKSSQEKLKTMCILNVWGASKVYYGRCANGEQSLVPFVSSRCHCQVWKRRDGWIIFHIIFSS